MHSAPVLWCLYFALKHELQGNVNIMYLLVWSSRQLPWAKQIKHIFRKAFCFLYNTALFAIIVWQIGKGLSLLPRNYCSYRRAPETCQSLLRKKYWFSSSCQEIIWSFRKREGVKISSLDHVILSWFSVFCSNSRFLSGAFSKANYTNL